MTAQERLSLALADALDRGLRVPCHGRPDDFTSDDPHTLEAAAADCDGCPAFDECEAAGQGASWAVWAGRLAFPSGHPKTRRQK